VSTLRKVACLMAISAAIALSNQKPAEANAGCRITADNQNPACFDALYLPVLKTAYERFAKSLPSLKLNNYAILVSRSGTNYRVRFIPRNLTKRDFNTAGGATSAGPEIEYVLNSNGRIVRVLRML